MAKDLEKCAADVCISPKVSDSDLPNEAANTSNSFHEAHYSEMQSIEEGQNANVIQKRWEMNYHEAAIFLEEGENNDKFNSHPKDQDALPSYLLVHNHWFYTLDLVASMMLLSLAAVEQPAIPLFAVPIWAHGSLEIFGLFIVATELFMKLRWQGWRTFVRHKRTMIKAGTLGIMFIEAFVVLVRQSNHLRVTRAIRPIFLIDNHYCGGVRRLIRQILQSLPPILDMLGLLFFFMLIFSVLGFYFFSLNPKDPYFTTLYDSFINLFVLLTTANYPDIMMPAYAKSNWAVVFFIIYLAIGLYFLMNLMLAVVYDAFTINEKQKFRKLLLHKRKACQHAFRLLVNKRNPLQMSFCHFEGLMKFFTPKKGHRDVYLIFKMLNTNNDNVLTLEEFYRIYDVVPIQWMVVKDELPWFHSFKSPCVAIFRWIYVLVTWKWFERLIYLIVLVNGIWILIDTANLSQTNDVTLDHFSSKWYHVMFVSIYAAEALLKILGFGTAKYFSSGWNLFDFTIMLLAAAGLVGEYFGLPFFFIVILRPLRLLTLFQMKRRYRDVFETLFILLPRMVSTSVVLLILYYFFAVIGMEMFAGYDMRNCCRNTTIEEYYRFNSSNMFSGQYYLNNFDNMFTAGVTLFELTVVNNWFVIMEGFAVVSSPWSRIYFMIFYLVTMVVMTIIVAFILEAFLFRIQYQRSGNTEDDADFTVDLTLSKEELHFCYSRLSCSQDAVLYTRDLNLPDQVIYRGKKPRTKQTLSTIMYRLEVKEWLTKAEHDDRLSANNSSSVLCDGNSINSSEGIGGACPCIVHSP